MKKFKKLIPAFCMLLVSAILLGSSTYAWFSMNDKATATGLNVTAKSNVPYLLIANTETTGTATTNLTDEVAAAGATNSTDGVYPVYYADGTETEGKMPGTAFNGADLSVTEGKWYTAHNDNSSNATDATKNVTEVQTSELSGYVMTYNVWLTLSKNSEDWTGKIGLKSVLGQDADAATSVVVEIGGTKYKLTNGSSDYVLVNSQTLKSTTNIAVTIYVYIDGTSTNVNSDYVNTTKNITGSVTVTFNLLDSNYTNQ